LLFFHNDNGKLLVLYMKNILILILLAVLGTTCTPKKPIYTKKVNPFIGTGGHGHTYPGATAPFGMVQLSPDTRVEGWDACSGYHYSDSTILGFSHTHLSGTGAADYGDILFTPRTNMLDSLAIPFSHADEDARAGFYSVKLANDIEVKLTTTTRVGIHEYSYLNSDDAYLAIDLEHGIGPDHLLGANWEVIDDSEISGYRRSSGWAKDQMVYFVALFSESFDKTGSGSDTTKAMLSFGKLDKPLIVKVGISSISVANARENILKEASNWNFNGFVTSAELNWDKELGKINAEFIDEDDEIIFYTALYHSFLAPNTYSDVNGEYRGMDKKTYTATGTHYSVYSLWDTFRATHPLFTILNQHRDVNMINSMLAMYEQGGLLPVWELSANETGTMIGYHSIPVITDAMVKKLPGFDYNLALEAMQASASEDHLGLKYYKQMGYVPAEKEHESVSKTLEYAYDDWCIAQAATILAKDEISGKYLERAQFYKNLYDPEVGFMRPKRNGNWMKTFDPYEVSGNYTEANAWQYNLFVPHDINNLNTLYGPATSLTNKLDSLFSASSLISGRDQPDIDGMIGQYAHGNEPSHNFAYLYNYTGEPWKTQQLVHKITTELYKNDPDGLSGNEDCGQMSSWYVLSALGFYPTVPGLAEYTIGTPTVKSAAIKLENGNTFSIQTNNLSETNFYVQSVELNGRPLERSYLYHEEIMKGGSVVFSMGDVPAKEWHNKPIEAPVSMVNSERITITPILDGGEMTFLDSTSIKIYSTEPEAKIFFTLDGSDPDQNSTEYTMPIIIDTTSVVKAMAIIDNRLPSKTAQADFIKIPYGRTIELKNQFSHLYTGNSQMALIDHLHGSANFRDGWQGYYEVDLEATVDLGKLRVIDAVSVGFLQDHYSWIFYPRELIVELSQDGKRFDHKVIIENFTAPMADGLITQVLGTTYPDIRARYVRIRAVSMGTCPDWHKGAGNPAWLFADEININTK
jgi:predicted alpha-1,2-mannosidase